jgi:hypothetical protein
MPITNYLIMVEEEEGLITMERDKLKSSNKTLISLNQTITAKRDDMRSSNELLTRDHASLLLVLPF